MFTDGYSEDKAFSRVMRESKFNGLAVEQGIPGCGNRPRKSLKAQKCTQILLVVWLLRELRLEQPMADILGRNLNAVVRSLDFILQDRALLWAYPWFLPFWRARVCHQMFVEVNSRADPVRVTGSLICSLELSGLSGR